MTGVISVCERIQAEFDGQCVCLQDIQLACGNQRQKQLLPAALVCEAAIVVFVHIDPSERGSERLRTRFRSVLNALVEKLDVSMNSLVLCGHLAEPCAERSEVCVFNIHNDRVDYYSIEEQLDDFLCSVIHDLKFRRPAFDSHGVSQVALNLQLITGANGEIKRDADGNYFIRKHGRWCEASDIDPDEMFQKAALFGAFGSHKFFDCKKSMGLAYFLTCGFFGIGWLLDCLAMIAGIYKDGEGRYLLPVTSRKDCFFKMLIGLGITAAYILLYTFLISALGDLLGGTINDVISSNSNSLSSLAEF